MNPLNSRTACPLCGNDQLSSFYSDKKRTYIRCLHCQLVFVPEEYRLSAESEKSEYDLHNNDPDDQGYRRFLSRLSAPLLGKMDFLSSGLDFGCGPGPTLSLMFEEAGHKVENYDPFYFNNKDVLSRKYDFITMTEVAEHLYNPKDIFNQLFNMLKSSGYLGIMTKLVIDHDAFMKWHYIQDPTHVCFFSRSTFEYLAEIYSARVEFIGNDVIIFQL